MKRMNLNDEEIRLIEKLREEKRFFRAGYETALKEMIDFVNNQPTFNEIVTKLEEMGR